MPIIINKKENPSYCKQNKNNLPKLKLTPSFNQIKIRSQLQLAKVPKKYDPLTLTHK